MAHQIHKLDNNYDDRIDSQWSDSGLDPTRIRQGAKITLKSIIGSSVATLAACIVIGCGGGGVSGGNGSGSTGGSSGGSSGGTGSTGGSGGGTITGSFDTDMVITQNMTVTKELRARDLVINPGVQITSPGDLVIQTAGKTTLNGQVAPSGKLTLVPKGGMNVGPQGKVMAGNGDVFILSSIEDSPTDEQMAAAFAKDMTLGAEKGKSRGFFTAVGRDLFGNPVKLPPIVWGPGSRRRNLWVFILGTLDVGGAAGGPPITYDFPPGPDGENRNGDNAKGGDGMDGGSAALAADRIEVTGPVTFYLGDGGNGGSATAGPTTSAKAIAQGGKGGNTGKFVMASSFLGILHGIDIQAQMNIKFGKGGRGGDATATGQQGQDGHPGEDGHKAKATGGPGGLGALPGSAGDLVTGLVNLNVTSQNGGDGGDATATGGRGGNDDSCPGTSGGKGGKATALGGVGGDSITSLAGGAAGSMTDGPGGNGGDATVNGGRGGDGKDCCGDDPKKGGNGGGGGDSDATPGNPGQGAPAGNAGNAQGIAGNGGDGGDGIPPGAGGALGIGSNVPNGNPGNPGQPCMMEEDCEDEEEPNDIEEGATLFDPPSQLNESACGTGTLSDPQDKDHFHCALAAGKYELTIPQAPLGGEVFYLRIGNEVANPPFGTTVTLTIPNDNTIFYIGFFGAEGSYKFKLKRVE